MKTIFTRLTMVVFALMLHLTSQASTLPGNVFNGPIMGGVGLWSDASLWSNNPLTSNITIYGNCEFDVNTNYIYDPLSGNYISLSPTANIVINGSLTIDPGLTFNDGTVLRGSITVNSVGSIINNGILNIPYTNLSNLGDIENGSLDLMYGTPLLGTITNFGVIDNGNILNSNYGSIITNNGSFTNNIPGILTNSGTITSNAGKYFTNWGIIENGTTGGGLSIGTIGTIINNGIFDNSLSSVINNNNSSNINNNGTFTNNGSASINNNPSSIITNNGDMTNGGTFNNNVDILYSVVATFINSNNHLFTNDGVFTNIGSATLYAVFTNNGTTENNGTIDNYAQASSFTSDSLLNNSIITLEPSSVISTTGYFKNSSSVNGTSGLIINTGVLDNSSTLNTDVTNNNILNNTGTILYLDNNKTLNSSGTITTIGSTPTGTGHNINVNTTISITKTADLTNETTNIDITNASTYDKIDATSSAKPIAVVLGGTLSVTIASTYTPSVLAPSTYTLISGTTSGTFGNIYVNGVAVNTMSSPWSVIYNTSGVVLKYTPIINPLSLSLLNFTVSTANNTNTLVWSTTDEKNNDKFEIQKSLDGIAFNTIGEEKSKQDISPNNSYEYLDATQNVGTIYYRLKMIATNSTYEYSKVIMVTNDMDSKIVLQNTIDKSVIKVLSTTDEKAIVVDMQGNVLQNVILSKGQNTLDISALPNAMYILKTKYSSNKFTKMD